MLLRARQFTFTFPRPALVMGVVNVTPDSFSDGGKFFDPAAAVQHALELMAEGASIVNDVGARRASAAMRRAVAESGAAYVAVHSRGSPRTMQRRPAYRDVVAEVGGFFAEQLDRKSTRLN